MAKGQAYAAALLNWSDGDIELVYRVACQGQSKWILQDSKLVLWKLGLEIAANNRR